MKKSLVLIFCLVSITPVYAQWKGKFEQLDQMLTTPNSYRKASGAPGENYWQQRADYDIDVELNDETQLITGRETITYFNNSPEELRYLWLQLDQNNLSPKSITDQTLTNTIRDSVPTLHSPAARAVYDYQGGFQIASVKDAATGNNLPYLINYTMMRVDLPTPLKTGQNYKFTIAWNYREKDRQKFDERGGYEYFPEDGNYIYTVAQWFPRMCVFDDYEGWQNKQFLGDGEFTLTFGNYKVNITVPSDHIVAATGMLQNPGDVLSKEQIMRFSKATTSYDQPVFIVTEAEARKKEKERSRKKSTWKFNAENVRDFAFASSRKFIWDAQAVKLPTTTPLAQSFYPKEGNPLWANESTKAVKNTLEVYSQRTFDYPYPTAISVHTANQGMEYPMICFNGGRPDKDGKISERTLREMVSVVVHEIGHNFFPMIVNSDERQWTWMDEGLNSFLEKETIRERYPGMDYSSNTPKGVASFMKGEKDFMRPIMASSDNQGKNHGPNGYFKPAAALTVLRETVMGAELFDKALREYSQRWAFKHPKPADFFRTMEDASAVDLDWFWRGWFYSTDHVDIELDEVKWFTVKKTTVDLENKSVKTQKGDLSSGKAGGKATDFSNGPQEFNLINTSTSQYREFRSRLNDNEIRAQLENKNVYEITLKNKGGLISPVIIEWTFNDGSKEIEKLPAEIWRLNEVEIKKIFVKDKKVVNVKIDPNAETADAETKNNVFPKRAVSKFDQLKNGN